MRKLDRLCIGVNFSAACEAAIASGGMLARAYSAYVDLLTVVEPPTLYTRVIAPEHAPGADVEKAVAEAREKLAALSSRFDAGRVTCEARVGSPFAELIAHCRERGDDLLIVGARAEQPDLQRLVLGHTVEHVLRKSPVPVLVAKRPLPERPEVILAPTDFSPLSRSALEEAIVLARQWGCRLILLHVIEPMTQLYGWGADLAGSEVYAFEPQDIEPEWKALLGEIDLNDVRWEQRTEQGRAAPAICRAAADCKADLIVIATHGYTALAQALLGSVADAVIRAAPCSSLSVRPEAMTFDLR
jgi:nucleotide-binding universal stress UspA family protein